MSLRLPYIAALVLLLWQASTPVRAGVEDLNTRMNSGVTTAEIKLSEGYEIQAEIFSQPVDRFVVRLQANDVERGRALRASQLDFYEPHHEITRITLEEESEGLFLLQVELRSKQHVAILPQYLSEHLLINLTPPKLHRKLTKRLLREDSASTSSYALTLESRRESMPTLSDIPRSLVGKHVVYVVPFEKEGGTWQRLRVGFYANSVDAAAARAQVLAYFPDAWVEQVSQAEKEYASLYSLNPQLVLGTGTSEQHAGSPPRLAQDVNVAVSAVTPSSMSQESVEAPTPVQEWRNEPVAQDLDLEEADAALRAKQYEQAIRLYTKALKSARVETVPLAMERLGVSRELNGQTAQAIRIYRDYLERYAQSLGADRVTQRLGALTALERELPSTLRAKKKRRDGWRNTASIAQFYRRYSLDVDGHSSVPIDALFTDIGVTTRRSHDGFDHEGQLVASYLLDFTEKLDGKEFQISRAAWESYSSRWRSGFKVGRQSSYDAGVLGRFDGIDLSHDLMGSLTLGLAAGYLVESSFDMPNTQRSFQSIYARYSALSGALRISPFIMQQDYEGTVDRQAVGLQVRLMRDSSHFRAMADYDFHHQVLNNVSIMTNVGLGESTTFSLSADQRRSPYISTRNALIGQPYDDLSDLERELVNHSLEELASDRTAVSRTVRFGVNKRLGKRWALSADALASDISSTDSSMNVVGADARQDIYYAMQIRALDVYGASSYSGLSLRQAISDTSSTQMLYWDNRFKLGQNWAVQPRLRLDHRKYDFNDQTQMAIKPSVRVNFNMGRKLRFEFEVGYELTSREQPSGDIDMSGLTLNLGYRALF